LLRSGDAITFSVFPRFHVMNLSRVSVMGKDGPKLAM
jgi:hypothetical protein